MIKVPSEDDFLGLPDMMDEALEVNRRQCLPAKPPTKNSSHAMAKAWCDDMAIELKQMVTQWEIDEWKADNQRYIHILHDTHRDLHDELVFVELEAAEDNARSITL
jgi:hypothetical protein